MDSGFKLRLKVEYSQLNFKINSLNSFINANLIDNSIGDELDLLIKQLAYMKDYQGVLAKRCKLHGIEI